MKRLSLLFLLFSFSAFGQVTNFIVKDNILIWENVFLTNVSSSINIPGLIARHPRLVITSNTGNLYKGTGSGIKNTCGNASAFMGNAFDFEFEIEMADGKYRVTVSNLKFGKSKKEGVGAESYLIGNGTLKEDQQSLADLNCLETFFNRIFATTILNPNKL